MCLQSVLQYITGIWAAPLISAFAAARFLRLFDTLWALDDVDKAPGGAKVYVPLATVGFRSYGESFGNGHFND